VFLPNHRLYLDVGNKDSTDTFVLRRADGQDGNVVVHLPQEPRDKTFAANAVRFLK
jgi:hypothetical protein